MSFDSEAFESIRLKMGEAKTDDQQNDLYIHLTKVFDRIQSHNKFDAYSKFEQISQLIKLTNLNIKDPKPDHTLTQTCGKSQAALDFIEKS